VLETRKQAIDFYRELVQNLRPWRAAAPPKLPEEPEAGPEAPLPEPPALSADCQREPSEAPALEEQGGGRSRGAPA
jgi:hypothetical protein